MATISMIRRSNLHRLRDHIKSQFESNPNNKGVRFTDGLFCDMIGVSKSTYSQLKKSKHKPYFNELYARRIESNLKLELGWFDINRDDTDLRLVKIGFDMFSIGLDAYSKFILSEKIIINDKESLNNLKENLFLFLFKNDDPKTISLNNDSFLDFLKKRDS